MRFLPIFLNIDKKTCLVVGGGDVATRKLRQLLTANAKVSLVAKEISDEISVLINKGSISRLEGDYHEGLMDGCELVIAATDDETLNKLISEHAQKRHLPVNVVDQSSLCSFIMPSVIDRHPVQIAISTGGASPVLARLLRARLETMIPSAYGRLAGLMQSFRENVMAVISERRRRRRYWENVLQGPVAEMLYSGQDKAALALLERQLENPDTDIPENGEVYLVGGGPGDPDLLTFRALRLMQQADVVL